MNIIADFDSCGMAVEGLQTTLIEQSKKQSHFRDLKVIMILLNDSSHLKRSERHVLFHQLSQIVLYLTLTN